MVVREFERKASPDECAVPYITRRASPDELKGDSDGKDPEDPDKQARDGGEVTTTSTMSRSLRLQNHVGRTGLYLAKRLITSKQATTLISARLAPPIHRLLQSHRSPK